MARHRSHRGRKGTAGGLTGHVQVEKQPFRIPWKRINRSPILWIVLIIALSGGAYWAYQKIPSSQPQEVNLTEQLRAVFETNQGRMVCELYPGEAPKTVANFVGLAEGKKEFTDPKTGQKTTRPFFDGLIFHRVIPQFMIQGGDPLGIGSGGPGYQFEDEFSSKLTFDRPGRLAMANSGSNTNGSQFFITSVPTTHLNNKHTIFGQVVEGQDVVEKISAVERDAQDKPRTPVVITKLTIERPK